MQGDFNQTGAQYESLAVAGEPGHYQMLSKEGGRFFGDLQRHLCTKWGSEPQSPELKRWAATIECLQSFLYQTKRLAQHSKELCSLTPPPEQLLGHSGIEALTDFETLLYLGRSALDRLTFAIAKQTYGQECEKFDKLAKVLGNYEKKEKRAEHAINVIGLALPAFQGVLIDGKDGKTGLRSLLAHSRSTGESLTHVFTVHRSADGKVLRFDLELERNGVLNTSWMLNQNSTVRSAESCFTLFRFWTEHYLERLSAELDAAMYLFVFVHRHNGTRSQIYYAPHQCLWF
jgi:hypothetical protein